MPLYLYRAMCWCATPCCHVLMPSNLWHLACPLCSFIAVWTCALFKHIMHPFSCLKPDLLVFCALAAFCCVLTAICSILCMLSLWDLSAHEPWPGCSCMPAVFNMKVFYPIWNACLIYTLWFMGSLSGDDCLPDPGSGLYVMAELPLQPAIHVKGAFLRPPLTSI